MRGTYLRQVAAYERESSDDESKRASLFHESNPAMQVCAREQRILIDAVRIADVVARAAGEMCGEQ